jgi:hypothetical protein
MLYNRCTVVINLEINTLVVLDAVRIYVTFFGKKVRLIGQEIL